jgi:DNA repair protein RadC
MEKVCPGFTASALTNHKPFKPLKMNQIAEIGLTYKPVTLSNTPITSSHQAYEILIQHWSSDLIQLQEEFKVLLLNRAHHVLGIVHLSKGGTSGTVVDMKLLFAVALKTIASGIILAHNHPSGNLKPSETDLVLTRKVTKGCEMLDICLLDHLIVTNKGYLSFKDEVLI